MHILFLYKTQLNLWEFQIPISLISLFSVLEFYNTVKKNQINDIPKFYQL